MTKAHYDTIQKCMGRRLSSNDQTRMVGGSQQETLDPGFVLFGTRQQVIPVIVRELILPDGFGSESSVSC
ncbi:unnamed protein product [Schistosoma curassoni]|uniref:Uncharacterized protein n=1 Tax=Schistosoma curassoni TaxID=6186 RepID=A0A183KMT2_9TREM|nr:unnamed protein product [Schistosoma curassoni]